MSPARLSSLLIIVMLLFAAAQCVSRLASGGVVDVTQNAAELEAVLQDIAYTAPEGGGNGVVYQISFRTCPPCIQAHENLLPKLQKAGLQARMVTTARRSTSTADERAAVAENARRKDWAFTSDWWADNSPARFYARADLPRVEGDAAREQIVEALRGHVDALSKIAANNNAAFGFPAFFWQGGDGQYKAAMGYNAALGEIILADLKPNLGAE